MVGRGWCETRKVSYDTINQPYSCWAPDRNISTEAHERRLIVLGDSDFRMIHARPPPRKC